MPDRIRPMIGMNTSSTIDDTMAPKAAPITTPMARSMTLPLRAKSRNSLNMFHPLLCCAASSRRAAAHAPNPSNELICRGVKATLVRKARSARLSGALRPVDGERILRSLISAAGKGRAMAEVLIDREDSLRQAVDFIPQGLAAFDRDLRLVTANSRYRDGLALLPYAGRPRHAALRHRPVPRPPRRLGAGRCDIPRGAARAGTHRLPAYGERSGVGALGQTLEFHSSRLPDGGLVISFCRRHRPGGGRGRSSSPSTRRWRPGRGAHRDLVRVNSELEVARAKADAANRDKTRFLAAASHDLLQPLNAARLYTATLVERAGGTGLDELAQLDRGSR
jgi:signal transduction histidine kinase